VLLAGPRYWSAHLDALLEVLALTTPPATISAPDDDGVDSPLVVGITDPIHWVNHADELEEALHWAAAGDVDEAPMRGIAVSMPERLTFTVEEAAAALGISRAFAYEAVSRGDIPSIRIGRRVLVPRTALQRMLESTDPPSKA
jgi:excisionase family DNA binding protein